MAGLIRMLVGIILAYTVPAALPSVCPTIFASKPGLLWHHCVPWWSRQTGETFAFPSSPIFLAFAIKWPSSRGTPAARRALRPHRRPAPSPCRRLLKWHRRHDALLPPALPYHRRRASCAVRRRPRHHRHHLRRTRALCPHRKSQKTCRLYQPQHLVFVVLGICTSGPIGMQGASTNACPRPSPPARSSCSSVSSTIGPPTPFEISEYGGPRHANAAPFLVLSFSSRSLLSACPS